MKMIIVTLCSFPATADEDNIVQDFCSGTCPGQSWLRGIFKGGWRVDPLVSVLSWLMASVMGGIWFAWMLELNGLAIF